MHFSIFLFFFLSINQFVFEDQGYIFNDLFSICLICVLKIAKLNWLNAWKFNPLTKFYWRFHMKNEWWKSKSATSHALQVEMNSILIYLNNVQAFEMTQLKCIYIVNSRRIRISWKKKKRKETISWKMSSTSLNGMELCLCAFYDAEKQKQCEWKLELDLESESKSPFWIWVAFQ